MIPLLLSTPEPMNKVRVITLRDSSEETLVRLRETGILHIEKAEELDPVDRKAIERRRALIGQAFSAITDILSFVRQPREIVLYETSLPPSVDDIVSRTEMIRNRCRMLSDNAASLEEEIAGAERVSNVLRMLVGKVDVPVRELSYSGTYLFSTVFSFPKEHLPLFQKSIGDHPAAYIAATDADDAAVYIISPLEGKTGIEEIARSVGAEFIDIPGEECTIEEFLAKNDAAIAEKRILRGETQRNLTELIEKNLDDLVAFREYAQEEYEKLSVIELACEARYVTLIEGWIPESRVGDAISTLRKRLQYAFVDTRPPKPGDAPPTKYANPAAVRPFQVIVSLFSLPKYGGWDPTPVVAYSFAFFFGLMLNDVIYAAGLILFSYFFLARLADEPASEEFLLFRKMLYISGTASLAMGALSGTYLGDLLTRAFAVDPASHALVRQIQETLSVPVSFIVFSLSIGLIHVNIGHMLALIKGLKGKNKGLVIGKIGLFMAQIFGIPYFLKTLLRVNLIPLSDATNAIFLYLFIAGTLLVILSGFMQTGWLGSITWIFELSGILGDVMSYSRLAGVGLATYYLASSFNYLASYLSSTASGILPGIMGSITGVVIAAVIFTVMHTFNLILSSIAAFIHSLRLCFVEFLIKFYEGGGIKYAPYRLQMRKSVVVGAKR